MIQSLRLMTKSKAITLKSRKFSKINDMTTSNQYDAVRNTYKKHDREQGVINIATDCMSFQHPFHKNEKALLSHDG